MHGNTQGEQFIGLVLQDTYTLERLLGAGGMGAVYEASHKRLQRRFAVKMLYPEVAAVPEAVSRFRREAEISSGLGHPNIIEVIDFNTDDEGRPYIIMELLDGEDLADRLKRGGPLSIPAAMALLGQVSSALDAAHAKGIIHRDLKPSNIFVCRRADGSEVVKVVDFGISKVVGAASVLTQTQASMGTPSYMSPEQAEGRAAEVDARTDVFALGTIVYEMLTGRQPFLADMIPAVLYKICHGAPPSLLALRPDLPPPVEQVVFKALNKAPADRHPSAGAFRDALATASGIPATAATGMPSVSPALAGPVAPATAVTDPSLVGEAVVPSTTLSAGVGQVMPSASPPPTIDRTAALPGGKRGMWIAAVTSGVAGLATVAAVIYLFTRPPAEPAAAGGPPIAVGSGGEAAGASVDARSDGGPADAAPEASAPPDARARRAKDASRRSPKPDARPSRQRKRDGGRRPVRRPKGKKDDWRFY